MRAGQLGQQRNIKGLDPAHVGHGGIQGFGGFQGRGQQGAEHQHRHPLASAADFTLAVGQSFQVAGQGHTGAAATRVAHRYRVVLLECGGQQSAAFSLVSRAGHRHVGNAAQKSDVVGTGMGGSVGPHQTGAVQRKHHGQVLQCHIVNQLVVCPLQKGGINGHHGFEPFAGQTGGKRHRMLLGNAHIVVTVWKTAVKLHHARALAHGRGDADQALVLHGHVAQPLAKHLGEGGRGGCGGLGQPHCRIKFARAVVSNGVGFGQLVAVAFFGDHMQELRALEVAQVFQGGDERFQIVPVNRAHIVEAEFFKQRGRYNHAFGLFFQPFGQLKQWRGIAQHLLAHIFGRRIELPAHQLGQIAVERAHGGRNRHIVVIQDHQQLEIVVNTGVVEGLERHACRHGPIANHGYCMAVFALLPRSHSHAQSRRNGGGRMGRAKSVVFALVALGKAADATQLAQAVHAVAPPRENFVRVGLVAHIPHDAVVRGVEHIVQRHGQLHRAQVGAEVPPCAGHAFQQKLAQFVGKAGQLRA